MKLDDSDLAFARRLEQQLADAPVPAPPDALLRRIHATIVAHDQPIAAARRARRWPWAVAAAALVVATLTFTRREPLVAGAMTGHLTFAPAAPQSGDTVRVRYEPSAPLARFKQLRLRARFRTTFGMPSPEFEKQISAAELSRGSNGAFTGSFVFPSDAVFGAFSVEDDAATVVDANRRALWTLLAPDSSGKPRFEALEQRIDDIATNNWELALATAREATQLHPTQVRGWMILQSLQTSTLNRRALDSALVEHRALLPSLDGRAAAASDDELGAMVDYAARLSDTVRASRWRALLVRRGPRGIWGVNALVGGMTEPHAALAFYDSLWNAGVRLHPGVLNFGFAAAQMTKDTAAVSLWLRRMLSDPRRDTTFIAQMMVQQTAQPALVAEGMTLLRSRLNRSPAEREAHRALEDTRERARLVDDDYRARTFRALGDALLARGETRAAADTLALAAQVGWDAKLFRRLGDLQLSIGDSAGARDMFARSAADPLRVDSARRASSSDIERATRAMRDQMLTRAERTTLPSEVRVVDAAGSTRRLSDLVSGKPTLVAFWSSFCPPSIAAMPTLLANGHALQARGFNVIAISEQPLDSATKAWLAERHFDLPVFQDRDREVRVALSQWGTPESYVLDGRGRLRYRTIPLSAVGAALESVR